jgi:hypothetical protein
MFNDKVIDVLALKSTKGDVGIEIEMETLDFIDHGFVVLKDWKAENDNSLKGNGTEFVLKKPCLHSKVPELMDEFMSDLKDMDVSILPSIRAGVHIHVNMQQATIKQVVNYMLCFYAMETVLTRFCGEGREGNLFCLRARDADFSIFKLSQMISDGDILTLRDQNLRYGALNVQSLFTFGSVEFRALATVPDLSNIVPWVDILIAVRDYAMGVDCMWDDLTHISAEGGTGWVNKVLGDELFQLISYPEMDQDVMADVQNMQHVAYQFKSACEA